MRDCVLNMVVLEEKNKEPPNSAYPHDKLSSFVVFIVESILVPVVIFWGLLSKLQDCKSLH